MGISISGSNSVVEFLPSKQAVAGSSPVSRSFQDIVSLQALLTPVGNNQAVKRLASRRCFILQKGVQRHPASIWGAHYFTRNRTDGSDFLLFSPLTSEAPTVVIRCFFAHF